MLRQSMVFLIFASVILGMSASPVIAAPTIKKFGINTTNNTQDNINKTSLTKLPASPRVSSVRAFGLSDSQANTNNSINIAAKPVTPNNSMRLSALHNSVIKGLSSKLSTSSAQQQQQQPVVDNPITSDLEQRVMNLETEVSTKQETLESGDGIIFDGKTISLTNEIMTLPDEIDEINQELDNLNEKINQIPGANVVHNFDPGFLLQ